MTNNLFIVDFNKKKLKKNRKRYVPGPKKLSLSILPNRERLSTCKPTYLVFFVFFKFKYDKHVIYLFIVYEKNKKR
jgi:hypothetical protein